MRAAPGRHAGRPFVRTVLLVFLLLGAIASATNPPLVRRLAHAAPVRALRCAGARPVRLLAPGALTVNASSNYTFAGSGAIIGPVSCWLAAVICNWSARRRAA